MNEIIDRISEIEAASARIIENANQKKKDFAAVMEQKTKDFDAQIEAETAEKLAALKVSLEKETQEELQTLTAETEKVRSALKGAYQKNHALYAKQILAELIKG